MQCFMSVLIVDTSPEELAASFLPIPIPTICMLTTNSYVKYLALNKPTTTVSKFGTQYYGTLMLQNTWQNSDTQFNSNWNGYEVS